MAPEIAKALASLKAWAGRLHGGQLLILWLLGVMLSPAALLAAIAVFSKGDSLAWQAERQRALAASVLKAGKSARYDYWRDNGLDHQETVARVEAEFVPDSADVELFKDTLVVSTVESYRAKTSQEVEAEVRRYHDALIRAGGTPKEVVSFLTALVGASTDLTLKNPRDARVLKWAAGYPLVALAAMIPSAILLLTWFWLGARRRLP